MSIEHVINELKAGNERYIQKSPKARTKNPSDLEGGQSPHTIVVTCSDSRVPPELIFDQDLGDLFVIRIAGNTASKEAIGSIEYAAANLGSSVILVMGHSKCGAVSAALDHVKTGNSLPSDSLQSVVDPIVPSVKKFLDDTSENALDNIISENVRHAIADLEAESEIVNGLKNEGKLIIQGCTYDLGSGKVNFFS